MHRCFRLRLCVRLACRRDEAAPLPKEAEALAMLQAVGWEAGPSHPASFPFRVWNRCTDNSARILTLAKGMAPCSLMETGQPGTSVEICQLAMPQVLSAKLAERSAQSKKRSCRKRILKGDSAIKASSRICSISCPLALLHAATHRQARKAFQDILEEGLQPSDPLLR